MTMKELLDNVRQILRQNNQLSPAQVNSMAVAAAQTEEAHLAHVLLTHQIRQERLAQRTNNELKRVVRY